MLLDHELAGSGPDVVLIHAAVGDRRLWDHQWPWLTARYRTLRFDLRGFGRSPLPPETYVPALDIIEVLEATDVSSAVFVAGSLGGLLALDVAAARPDLVEALVLVSPAFPREDRSPAMQAFAQGEDAALECGDIDTAVELNLRMWFDGPQRAPNPDDADRRALVGDMQRRAFEVQLTAGDDADDDLLAEDLGSRVRDIAAPTLILVGEHDVSDFHEIATFLVDEMPAAEYRILPGTAHVPFYERPEVFDPILREALEGFAVT